MKKTLAILLSVTMLFALCVPGFAAVTSGSIDQTGAGAASTQNGSGVVKTVRNDSSTNPDGTFSVTFPATMNVTWGDASTTFTYNITSQLVAGKRLNVAIAPVSNTVSPVMTISGTDKTLAYSLAANTANALDYTTTTEVVNNAAVKFDVKVADWSVAYGEYQDNLTFTVSVVNA